MGEERVSWGLPRLPSQESGAPALRNFSRSPVFMPTPFNAIRPNLIRRGNAYEDGRVLGGQPSHCISTNVSHSLTAITEFLKVLRAIKLLIKVFSKKSEKLSC